MPWDVQQYERFRDERARPFLDLLARVRDVAVRTAVDLGCGTAELTLALCDRWPGARVVGVDSSAEMLAAAAPRAVPGRLELVHADLAAWRPAAPVDLVLSNATLHWVPDHEHLIDHLAGHVADGGVLALQMPDNFAEPSHRLLVDTAADGPWAAKLAARWRPGAVMPARFYVERLEALGLAVDAWHTTYYHVLEGTDPVLEWVKGTTLRPVLALLGDEQRDELLAAYGARLRRAYRPGARGTTIFPFRRLFVVARR